MNAETIIKQNTRYDKGGCPVEVVIPYETFIDFIESNGLDLSEEEKQSAQESNADIKAGRRENFVSVAEAKQELGL